MRLDASIVETVCDLANMRWCPLGEGLGYLRAKSLLPDKALANFEALFAGLRESGLADCCLFDAGIYRSLNFYSGITIQGDILPKARGDAPVWECMGGGEFTGLVESFGVRGPVHSVGMAIGIDRLMKVGGKRK